jgi:hypothetical protein
MSRSRTQKRRSSALVSIAAKRSSGRGDRGGEQKLPRGVEVRGGSFLFANRVYVDGAVAGFTPSLRCRKSPRSLSCAITWSAVS